MKDAEEGMKEVEGIPDEIDLWEYEDARETRNLKQKIKRSGCPDNLIQVIVHAVVANFLGPESWNAIFNQVSVEEKGSEKRTQIYRDLYHEFRRRLMSELEVKKVRTGGRQKRMAARVDSDGSGANKKHKMPAAAKADAPAVVEPAAAEEVPPAVKPKVAAAKVAPPAADPDVDAVAEAVKSVSLEADVGGADKPASDALIPPKQKAKMVLEKIRPRLRVNTPVVLRDCPVTPEIDTMVTAIREFRQVVEVDASVLDRIGTDGFQLNEPQKVEVRRLLQTLPITKMAFLDTGIGAGKTATALGLAAYQYWTGLTAITFLVVPENIRAQWSREIAKLLPKENYTVWDIQMDQMPDRKSVV
jgi:hypothetical protein